ncbi:MAG: SCO family protein [Devosia marina]|uniref:SCO family protein n=1 Tax=Devosia marina TaxID=2683198 RepID=UPI0032EE758E
MKSLRVLRIVLWALVLVAGAGAAYLFLSARNAPVDAGPAVYATPFTLIDQDGNEVTEADFLGKPSAWFYGFTHCPDVCPTTLSEMSALLEALGPDADRLQAVFVSVDPERDDVATMKDYVEYFDDRIVGLTGSLEDVSAMAKARYIFFEKVPLDGGDYTMEHSASVHLADAGGSFFGTLDGEEPFDTRLQKLRRLIE